MVKATSQAWLETALVVALFIVLIVAFFLDLGRSGQDYPKIVGEVAKKGCATPPVCATWQVLRHRDYYLVQESYPDGTHANYIIVLENGRFVETRAEQ